MTRINRDAMIAIFLLLVCGIFFWASFDIRQPDYGTLKPSTWPRVILVILSGLSLIYLIQSLRAETQTDTASEADAPKGFAGWLSYWRNVLWCFGLFLIYLLSMPTLGMLIGGVCFVFLLLCALGGWQPRQLALHAAIALGAVGGMWSLFTYGLGVILPTGVIFSAF